MASRTERGRGRLRARFAVLRGLLRRRAARRRTALDTLSMGMSHRPRAGDRRGREHRKAWARRSSASVPEPRRLRPLRPDARPRVPAPTSRFIHEDHLPRRRQHGLRPHRRHSPSAASPSPASRSSNSARRRARALAQRPFGVRAVESFDDAALACDVLVLAVKPQQMKAALAPIAGRLGGQLVISIAAGLRLADLGRWLGCQVRPMPAWCAACPTPCADRRRRHRPVRRPSVDAAGREAAGRILGAVGSIVWADDEGADGRGHRDLGQRPGLRLPLHRGARIRRARSRLRRRPARAAWRSTPCSARRGWRRARKTPAVLRQKVTSKGGTTEAALASLAAVSGWHDELVAAVQAAEARGRELGAELGRDEPCSPTSCCW